MKCIDDSRLIYGNAACHSRHHSSEPGELSGIQRYTKAIHHPLLVSFKANKNVTMRFKYE